MKRIFALLFLMVILSVIPSVFAEERAQTYSGFAKFVDNVRMLLSFGDKKVKVALEIRDKEFNSAMVNTKNGDDVGAEKNLKRARQKLQFIQSKVSQNTAEDVKTGTEETIGRVNEDKDLPDSFDTYVLEEEKTGLTADLVMEVGGKEGQTLTRETIKDIESGENKVELIVTGDDIRTEVMEIEKGIREIDNQIADIIVQNNVVKTGMDTDDLDKRDPNATPKTPAGDVDNTVDPGPQGIVGSDHEQGTVDED